MCRWDLRDRLAASCVSIWRMGRRCMQCTGNLHWGRVAMPMTSVSPASVRIRRPV